MGLVALFGCTPHRAEVKASSAVAKIQRISVHTFVGGGGQAITDEMIRQILGTGVEVADKDHKGDAILEGRVIEYKSNQSQMVFLGNTSLVGPGGQMVVINNPVIASGSAPMTPDSPTMGLSNAQVVSQNAAVTAEAKLVDPSTGATLWSGRFSYEALDMPAALNVVAETLVRSLRSVIPNMRLATS